MDTQPLVDERVVLVSGEIAEITAHSESLAVDLAYALRRITKLENEVEQIKSILSEDISKKAMRASALNDALGSNGKISRAQAQYILGNVHHKVALDAMKEAVKIYSHLVLTKNKSGSWILAVK